MKMTTRTMLGGFLLGASMLAGPAGAQPAPGPEEPAAGTPGRLARILPAGEITPGRKLAIVIQALHRRLMTRDPFRLYSGDRRHETVLSTLKLLGIPVRQPVPYQLGLIAIQYALAILSDLTPVEIERVDRVVDQLLESYLTESEVVAAAREVLEKARLPGEPGGPVVDDTGPGSPQPPVDEEVISLDDLGTILFTPIVLVNVDTPFLEPG